jgi:drug/metabolite transporter (DMT)-like permease
MKPEITPKQRWLIRTGLVLPFMVPANYYLLKLDHRFGIVAISQFLVGFILCLLPILVAERKYEYQLPSKSDYIIFGLAFCLLAAVNFGVTYGFHSHNRLDEAIGSVLNILPILPFLLFVKAKDGKLKSPEVKNS